MFKIKYVFVFCMLIILTSCKRSLRYKKNVEGFTNFEQEAKFFDIPVPFNVKIIKDQNSPNFYSFWVNKKNVEVLEFFKQQMEIYGWVEKDLFESNAKKIAIYAKPNKSVVIYIEGQKNNTLVSIFLKSKYTALETH